MKYDTVIFDLDGTLLNTLEDLADSVNFALNEMKYPLRSLEEIRAFVGNGVANLISRSVPNETGEREQAECLKLFREHYTVNMNNKTRPYNGILPLIKRLKENGIKMAVVSNKYDQAVKALCREFFGDLFNVAIGATAEIRKKPAPDTVIKALKELDAAPDHAIYAGDSEVDMATTRNAGLASVGVTWGFRDKSVLINEGAKYIIDSPEELISIIGLI